MNHQTDRHSRWRSLRLRALVFNSISAVLLLAGLVTLPTSFVLADVPRAGSLQEIIGGIASPPDAQSWMVALIRNATTDETPVSRRQFCGGVLVSDEWILTAAHCVLRSTTENTSVIIGENELDEAAADQSALAQIVVHPNYNSRTFENDVALLKLAQATQLQPIAVASAANDVELAGQVATAFGWGQTYISPDRCTAEFADSEVDPADFDCQVHDFSRDSRPYQNRLLQAEITILSDVECNARIRDLLESLQIGPGDAGQDFTVDRQICAYDPLEREGVCFGDSGGPLVGYQNGATVLLGITSLIYGRGGCAREFATDVFTVAAPFRVFMDSVMYRDTALSFENFCPPAIVPTVEYEIGSNETTRTTVRWNAYEGATRYLLRYSPVAMADAGISTIELDGSVVELSAELDPGMRFYVAVQAENESCTGPSSEVITVQVPSL